MTWAVLLTMAFWAPVVTYSQEKAATADAATTSGTKAPLLFKMFSQEELEAMEKNMYPAIGVPTGEKGILGSVLLANGAKGLPRDKELDAALLSYSKAWLARQTEILGERKSAVQWNAIISYLIFAITHAILGFACWASWGEFREASRLRKESRGKSKPAGHEIEISAERIALKTSLHGTVLLAFAAFFYICYLKFVFPISEVF